jgi:hypothetical protein
MEPNHPSPAESYSPGQNPQRRHLSAITTHTLFSFHVLAVLAGLAIWAIRLGDKVETHEKILLDLQTERKQATKESVIATVHIDKRLYRIEERLNIKHPRESEEE